MFSNVLITPAEFTLLDSYKAEFITNMYLPHPPPRSVGVITGSVQPQQAVVNQVFHANKNASQIAEKNLRADSSRLQTVNRQQSIKSSLVSKNSASLTLPTNLGNKEQKEVRKLQCIRPRPLQAYMKYIQTLTATSLESKVPKAKLQKRNLKAKDKVRKKIPFTKCLQNRAVLVSGLPENASLVRCEPMPSDEIARRFIAFQSPEGTVSIDF
jgi:hypothetical protein